MILKVYRLQELHEYSFMAVFKVESSFIGDVADLNVFVCSDDLLCREELADCVFGAEVGRYVLCGTTPDPLSVVDLPEHALPEYTVYPNRVLETIASLADLDEYTTDPGIDLHSYYRADTVAMIFNTEDLMNRTIEMVTEDVRKHVRVTEGKSLDVELKTYSETTTDDLVDYFFRG